MPAASPAAVRSAFDAVQTQVASAEVAAKAARVCAEFGLGADALASHWESFALNHSGEFDTDALDHSALDALRAHVKRSETNRKKKQARATTFRRGQGQQTALGKRSVKGAFSTPSPPKRGSGGAANALTERGLRLPSASLCARDARHADAPPAPYPALAGPAKPDRMRAPAAGAGAAPALACSGA